MKVLKFTLLFILSILFFSFNPEKPLSITVTLEDGTMEGTIENGIKAFKGIPFAAPPVRDLRWKAPQPVVPWKGLLKVDKFKAGSIQDQNLEQSEDCLYLNIWTKAKYAKDKLPVMVWIHGGGFTKGAPLEATYFGEKLTNKGVIYVSVAYRLGVLGFLAHPELSAESPNNVSGNYGLLDMIAALKWVKKNISAFGGDSNKVTIFGESAGAIAISTLCASPLTKGLFVGAICESGSHFAPITEGSTLKGAEKNGVEFMKQMGVSSIEELRKKDPKEFFKSPLSGRGASGPNVDGYVSKEDQYKLYEAGNYNDINVMIGSNSDEGAAFSTELEPDVYIKNIKERYGNFADKFLEKYPAKTKEQARFSSSDMIRDSGLGWGAWTWARLQARTGKSKVFLYYFDQKQPPTPQVPGGFRGAPHAAEIKYVLENINPQVYGKDDLILSDMMGTYWTNFAKYGDPNGKNLAVWPKFKEHDQKVMYFINTPKQVSGVSTVPNLDKLQLFEEYYKSIRKQE